MKQLYVVMAEGRPVSYISAESEGEAITMGARLTSIPEVALTTEAPTRFEQDMFALAVKNMGGGEAMLSAIPVGWRGF